MDDALLSDRLGRCYELSGRYIVDHPGCRLVHGSIQGFGYPRINHAWVILPSGDRHDPVADLTLSPVAHEAYFSAIEDVVYDAHEAMAEMLRHK